MPDGTRAGAPTASPEHVDVTASLIGPGLPCPHVPGSLGLTDAFTAAGFQISVISEPQPEPEARDLFPEDFELLATAPSYLFFVLRAV